MKFPIYFPSDFIDWFMINSQKNTRSKKVIFSAWRPILDSAHLVQVELLLILQELTEHCISSKKNHPAYDSRVKIYIDIN